MTEQDAPLAFPFPPADSLFQPSPTYTRLREEASVTQIRTPDGKTAWLVTRHADVRFVLTDPRFSRAAAAGPGVPVSGLGRLASGSMLGMDPPEHTRLRKLVTRAFTARRVEELRPRTTKLVDELLTAVQPLPRPVDLMNYFSLQLPIHVISELLGIPWRDRILLHDWSDTVMGDWQQHPDDLDRALDNLVGYFSDLISVKRTHRADDLMTALIAARDEADRLSESELVNLCMGLLIAGHETTVSQLNMFLVTLLEHPGHLARLRADPALVPRAVDELLRYVQISASGGTLPRVTTEEVEIGGVRLPAGSVVMTATNSANRDVAAFGEPDRLDLARTDNPHLTFGTGLHYCLGAQLARMELQEAIRGVLRHMPDLTLAVPCSELRFKRGMFIRTLENLPVTW
ncbi:cytochrome P450 [Micromonospora chersina]|uniref:cytochrome P450 n=1 Tax=Micromonospora chersina TaxID=47854 RepID=UPI0033E62052